MIIHTYAGKFIAKDGIIYAGEGCCECGCPDICYQMEVSGLELCGFTGSRKLKYNALLSEAIGGGCCAYTNDDEGYPEPGDDPSGGTGKIRFAIIVCDEDLQIVLDNHNKVDSIFDHTIVDSIAGDSPYVVSITDVLAPPVGCIEGATGIVTLTNVDC